MNLTPAATLIFRPGETSRSRAARPAPPAAPAQAGGDINIGAESTTNTTHLDANSRTSSVSNDRQEERLTLSTLGGDQGVTLVAGNRLLAEGAQIDSKEGRIGVSAQDVTIKDARSRTQDQDSENKREGKTKSHREEQTEREISTGSTFSGQQGVTVIGREGDVTVTGSTLHSDSNNADVSLYHHLVCRLTRLV